MDAPGESYINYISDCEMEKPSRRVPANLPTPPTIPGDAAGPVRTERAEGLRA